MKLLFSILPAVIGCFTLLHTAALGQDDNAAREAASSEMYGNPYFIKDWSDGTVTFTSGRIVKQFRLRFDCVRNQLLMQFQGSTFAAESKVKEFVLYTRPVKNKDSVLFRKGYPAVDKATENTFYQVLFEDKVQLLRLVSKNIVEEKELIASSNTRGRLEEEEKYYLLKEGIMVLLPAEKDELLKALPDKADALSAFINEHHLRFKTHNDYTRLAKKYNELLQ